MTVSELIAKLSTFDGKLPVIVESDVGYWLPLAMQGVVMLHDFKDHWDESTYDALGISAYKTE